MNSNSTKRFTDRVENYIKYRPGYPPELIKYIKLFLKINNRSENSVQMAADVGSGTGIFSKYLLDLGLTVFGVEPNTEMRIASETMFKDEKNFISIEGTSENTGLKNKSIDVIFAAQAFHWFDLSKTKVEFKRILRHKTKEVFLVWNERITTGDKFLEDYEKILTQYANDYNEVNHVNIGTKELNVFYGNENYKKKIFRNLQIFDDVGFYGRVFSSSYVPLNGKRHDIIKKKIEELFESYNENGYVKFFYNTVVYHGLLS